AVTLHGAPTPGGCSSRHAAGATGQGLAGPPLPHPEFEELTLLVRTRRDPFDIDATAEGGLQLGAQFGDVHGRRVGPEEDEMRVPDIDRPRRPVFELLRLVGSEPGRAHV